MKYFSRMDDIKKWYTTESALYYTGGDKRWLRDKIRWQRLVGPEDSNNLIFGIAELDPGETHLLHKHSDAAELYLVLEGEGLFRVNDEERFCEKGHCIYSPPGASHRVHNNGDQKLVIFFAYDRPWYNTELEE